MSLNNYPRACFTHIVNSPLAMPRRKGDAAGTKLRCTYITEGFELSRLPSPSFLTVMVVLGTCSMPCWALLSSWLCSAPPGSFMESEPVPRERRRSVSWWWQVQVRQKERNQLRRPATSCRPPGLQVPGSKAAVILRGAFPAFGDASGCVV